MSNHTKEQAAALSFMATPRGRFILSQALYYAIGVLKAVPTPFREASNISDMQFLRETLFGLFDESLAAMAAEAAAKAEKIVAEEEDDGDNAAFREQL